MAARRRLRSRGCLIALALCAAAEALAGPRDLVADVAWRLEHDSAVPPAVPGSIARAGLAALGLSTAFEITSPATTRTSMRAAIGGRKIDARRAIEAMTLAANDPHTYVLSRDVRVGLMEAMEGRTHVELGVATVTSGLVRDVVRGCTADALGVKPGDVIRSIDGAPYTRRHERALFGRDRGEPVKVEIVRGDRARQLSGRTVECRPPAVSWRLERDAGILRVRAMTVDGQREEDDAFRAARRALIEAKVSKLVLDLRGNRGGAGVEPFVALFTTAETLYLKRTPDGDSPITHANEVVRRYTERLAILVDARTASAAEMVAFALQRHANARVFGEPTAGAMTFPGGRVDLDDDGDVRLFYPRGVVVDPLTNAPRLRVTPDRLIPSPTAEQIRASIDPALEAALRWISGD